MRKILKALSLVMVLVMCFTMVFTTAVSAEGTDTLVLSVDNAAPKAGDTVNITVTSNFTTVAGAHFAIDLAGLEYVSVAGDYAEYFSAETMNFVKEFNEDNGNLVESGVLFVITATVPADAEAGTVYNVGFGTIATNKEFCDYNENEVVVTKTGVDVTVAADEPEVPECECKNLTYVSADLGENTITFVCDDCGESVTKTLYYNKYARAGYVSAAADAQTLISFGAYYQKDFARIDANAVWDDLYIVLDQTRNDEAIDSAVYSFADVEDVTSDAMYKVYYGLAAYMYADNMTATVFVHDSVADKWYTGQQVTSSLKALAESQITKTTGVQQSMWVDLLNYGAAAQVYFEKNTENLANNAIDSYQDIATTPKEYTKLPVISKGADPTPFYFYNFTGVVESKITLRSYFRLPSNYTGTYAGTNADNLTAVAKWIDYTGTEQKYEVTLGEEGFALVSGYTDRWDFYLPIGAPDLRSDITCEIYDGETLISTSSVVSFEAYVNFNYKSANENLKNLCDAMMAFGDSVNAYLTSK